ncbi:hypothetical protein SLA2020_381710 [Shorea laevis]
MLPCCRCRRHSSLCIRRPRRYASWRPRKGRHHSHPTAAARSACALRPAVAARCAPIWPEASLPPGLAARSGLPWPVARSDLASRRAAALSGRALATLLAADRSGRVRASRCVQRLDLACAARYGRICRAPWGSMCTARCGLGWPAATRRGRICRALRSGAAVAARSCAALWPSQAAACGCTWQICCVGGSATSLAVHPLPTFTGRCTVVFLLRPGEHCQFSLVV